MTVSLINFTGLLIIAVVTNMSRLTFGAGLPYERLVASPSGCLPERFRNIILTIAITVTVSLLPAKAEIQCFQILMDTCLRKHDRVSDYLRNHHY